MTSPHTPIKDQTPHQDADQAPAAAAPLRDTAAIQEIERLREESAKYKDQWIRTAAELENTRKRAQRELEEANRYGISALARDMVEILENLKRASDTIPAEARLNDVLLSNLGEGVDLTLKSFLNIFRKYEINRVDPLNQKFDPNIHQAVVQIERTDVPPGTVVQVVQAGYTIGNRLLKPAMVAVSKAPERHKPVDETA